MKARLTIIASLLCSACCHKPVTLRSPHGVRLVDVVSEAERYVREGGLANEPGDAANAAGIAEMRASVLGRSEAEAVEAWKNVLAASRNLIEPKAFGVIWGKQTDDFEAAVLFRDCTRGERGDGKPPFRSLGAAFTVLIRRGHPPTLQHDDTDAREADLVIGTGSPTDPGECQMR